MLLTYYLANNKGSGSTIGATYEHKVNLAGFSKKKKSKPLHPLHVKDWIKLIWLLVNLVPPNVSFASKVNVEEKKKKKKILAGYTLSGTAVSLETFAISSLIIQGPNGN